MTDIDFGCTECGRCCHGLKLPLTVDEAVAWLEDGNQVQLLCEAIPWPVDPPVSDLQAHHKRRRSFAGLSGTMPTRSVVTLAASFPGACPNLGADMRCRIYDRRPLVCRIYPSEISPFIQLDPSAKACPPDAWRVGASPLLRGGLLVDLAIRECIAKSKAADESDVSIKATLSALLTLDAAAMANEGFVVYSPERKDLLAALAVARRTNGGSAKDMNWRFVSNQRATVEALLEIGASSSPPDLSAHGVEYLGFRGPAG